MNLHLPPSIHPSGEQLLAHACGEGDRSFRAVVEAHLAACPACGATVAEEAQLGGVMLAGLPPAPLPPELFSRILAAIPEQVAPDPDEIPLPEALRPLLPPPEERSWGGALSRGVRFLKLVEEKGAQLFLVHIQPGATFPHHAHSGGEVAVMLAGGTQVGSTRYEAGDWAEFPAGSHHAPQALPAEACWILARVEGPMRLTGWRGAIQKLMS